MKRLMTLMAVALLASGCTQKVTPPHTAHAPDGRDQPQYPAKAQALRIEGIVRASYTVNEKGCAENIRILSAQPEDIFERDTIRAMNKWCGQQPTSTPKKIIITFRLNGGAQVHYDTTKINAWAQAVKAEIESKMNYAEQYRDKVCAVRIFLLPSGMVMSVQSEGGDPALCQAAIEAVKVSTFPPVPKELQGQKGILLDFKP